MDYALNTLIYGYSWYLDEAAPGWDALVLDDYEAVFPLIHNRKFFIRYLYQPLFTQQLGLFYRNLLGAEQLSEFIKAIPEKFRFIDINLNEANMPGDENVNIPLTRKKNYVLDLEKPYPKITKGFSEQTRRNIAKSHKTGLSISAITADAVIDLYVRNKGPETIRVTTQDYRKLSRIAAAINRSQLLHSVAVVNDTGTVLASALFAIQQERIIYLIGASTQEGRARRAMYFLFDHLVREYAEKPFLLDFEGSEIPGVARFFKGLGGKKQPYYKLHINRMPWYIRWVKK
jgi:hypothetical protein